MLQNQQVNNHTNVTKPAGKQPHKCYKNQQVNNHTNVTKPEGK